MSERRIYTDEDAERYFKASAGKPYRPSNGVEGEIFDSVWCAHCDADHAFRQDMEKADGCPIIANVMAMAIDDPGYPQEWRYGPSGQPMCSAFRPVGCAATPFRCAGTADLFGERDNINAEDAA